MQPTELNTSAIQMIRKSVKSGVLLASAEAGDIIDVMQLLSFIRRDHRPWPAMGCELEIGTQAIA